MTTKRAQEPCPFAAMAGLFFDGELSVPEAKAYARHLFACPDCRNELRTVRRLSLLLRGEAFPGSWGETPETVPAGKRAEALPGRSAEAPAGRPVAEPRPRPSLAGQPLFGGAGNGCD